MNKQGSFSLALCVALLAGILFLVSSSAQAKSSVLYVAPGGDCGGASPCYATIQGAVDAASDGDTIKVAQGTYTGAGFQVAYIDKSITLRGGYATTDWVHSYSDTRPTIFDAESVERRRVIQVHGNGGGSVLLAGITLQRGNSISDGGGVYLSTSRNVTLLDCKILDNSAASGGAVHILTGMVTMQRCSISNNHSDGIYMAGTALIIDSSTVQSNEGSGTTVASGNVTITHSTLKSNRGSGIVTECDSSVLMEDNLVEENEGTGIETGGSSDEICAAVTIKNNSIRANQRGVSIHSGTTVLDGNTIAEHGTAGVYVEMLNRGRYAGTVTIINNIIENNTNADGPTVWPENYYGGGVCVYGSDAIIRANLIRGNTSVANGGGIWVSPGLYNSYLYRVDIQDNVVFNNRAQQGGGIQIAGGAVNLAQNAIISNSATVNGAGLVLNGGGDLAPVSIERNTIMSNTAPFGSGLSYIGYGGGHVTASNDIIARNIPSLDGVYITGGTLIAAHWTLVDNGSYALSTDSGGTAVLTNTVVASHTLAGLWGLGIDATHMLAFNTGTPCGGGAVCANIANNDPAFVDSMLGNYHIGPGSAAIDSGIQTGVVRDIDGEPRTGIPDLGADEYWAPGALKAVYLPLVLRGTP